MRMLCKLVPGGMYNPFRKLGQSTEIFRSRARDDLAFPLPPCQPDCFDRPFPPHFIPQKWNDNILNIKLQF